VASEKLSDIARSGQVIAIRAGKVGVIIARGDLAVECGRQGLAEEMTPFPGDPAGIRVKG